MERRRERYLYYLYLRLFKEGAVPVWGERLPIFHLLDFEIADITSIIASKRYKMDAEETKIFNQVGWLDEKEEVPGDWKCDHDGCGW